MLSRTFFFICTIPMMIGLQAQEANYDESRVPAYTLPDLLKITDGSKVTTVEQWEATRRPEILNLFEEYVYGRVPDGKVTESAGMVSRQQDVMGGMANRFEFRIALERNGRELSFNLLVFLPAGAEGPVPVFLGYNFNGNHTVNQDPGISITDSWVSNNKASGITDNRATESSRGMSASRWPLEMILEHGYGIATMYYGDIDPDFDDSFRNGIHPMFYNEGQKMTEKDEWGSIAAWAWGLSRAMDYLVDWNAIDPARVIVIGHSRLGKTALWAGAMDTRFAIVISNDSGCGGAALSRREFGETVERINTSFPHWFCRNFHDFNSRVGELPVDQHMLIAMIAPRPVYIASARDDQWADPHGEYLSAYYAKEVYNLYGPVSLGPEPPAVNSPLKDQLIGYHIRSGPHDITRYDWEQYLDFADMHLPE